MNEITASDIVRTAHPSLDTDIDGLSLNEDSTEFVHVNELTLLLEREGVNISKTRSVQERRQTLLDAFGGVRESIREFDHCLIKLPELPKPIDDIDLLIEDTEQVHQAFRSLEYRREEKNEISYRKEIAGNQSVVDIYPSISWQGVEYLDGEKVIRNARVDQRGPLDALSVPSYEDALLIISGHSVFDRGSISLFEAIFADYIRERYNLNLETMRTRAEAYGWRPAFDHFLTISDEVRRIVENDNSTGIDLHSFPYFYPMQKIVEWWFQKIAHESRSDLSQVKQALVAYPQDGEMYVRKRLGRRLYGIRNK